MAVLMLLVVSLSRDNARTADNGGLSRCDPWLTLEEPADLRITGAAIILESYRDIVPRNSGRAAAEGV